jgi:hypothetical protein
MTYKLFPEKDKDLSRRILRAGMRFIDPNEEFLDTINCFRDLGIIRVQEKRFVKCSNEYDKDYLDLADPDCPGEIVVNESGDEYYCDECGRPINEVSNKQHFEEHTISLDRNGMEIYVKEALNSLSNTKETELVSPFVFNVITAGDKNLKVVIPPYSGIRYQYSGLFFAEPVLYIIPSPIQEPVMTVLDKQQYLGLADLLSQPVDAIAERLEVAGTPIEGRRYYEDIEARFDEMLERHKEGGWQFFEQDFIPALVNHIAGNPELASRYLEELKRLKGTIFGDFYVAIGGGGVADLRPIKKFELMNQLFSGNFTGDAKYYSKKKLDYNEIIKINYHLDSDPAGANLAIVYVSSNNIVSSAWDAMMKLKRPDGRWKVIILPKYLIFELLSELEAISLLEM